MPAAQTRRTLSQIEEELKAQPADVLLHLVDEDSHTVERGELDNLSALMASHPAGHSSPKVVGIVWQTMDRFSARHNGDAPRNAPGKMRTLLQNALQAQPGVGPHFLQVIQIPAGAGDDKARAAAQNFMSMLARSLPNEARVEMARTRGRSCGRKARSPRAS